MNDQYALHRAYAATMYVYAHRVAATDSATAADVAVRRAAPIAPTTAASTIRVHAAYTKRARNTAEQPGAPGAKQHQERLVVSLGKAVFGDEDKVDCATERSPNGDRVREHEEKRSPAAHRKLRPWRLVEAAQEAGYVAHPASAAVGASFRRPQERVGHRAAEDKDGGDGCVEGRLGTRDPC
jgi:hypothetical protein